MSQYKCINGFTTFLGKRYSYGDKIDTSTYAKLTSDSQKNFRKEEESFSSGLYDSYTPSTPPIDMGSGSSLDWSSGSDSSSSSDSSFDFGGGDTGGGGASGDW